VQPRLASWLIAAALAFNLLTPAQHVIETWAAPVRIYSLRYELNHLSHPPPHLAGFYLLRASQLAEKHQLSRALAEIDAAVRIDPNSASMQMSRGALLTDMGRAVEAAACYDVAVRLAPRRLDVYVLRARFRRAHGQFAAAEEDLRLALNLSPEGSRDRAELKRELAEVRRIPARP
jgi:Flp pilus assembly protein TadD